MLLSLADIWKIWTIWKKLCFFPPLFILSHRAPLLTSRMGHFGKKNSCQSWGWYCRSLTRLVLIWQMENRSLLNIRWIWWLCLDQNENWQHFASIWPWFDEGTGYFCILWVDFGLFQHHRVRTSSVLNHGFLENKGAPGRMRFLLDSSSVAMGLLHFTVKNEQNVNSQEVWAWWHLVTVLSCCTPNIVSNEDQCRNFIF